MGERRLLTMYRFATRYRIAGRILPRDIKIGERALYPQRLNAASSAERYSTKARDLMKVLPELWIVKMKTAFDWLDVDGDGYLSEKDFAKWVKEMTRLFPDLSEEQKKILISMQSSLWDDMLGGKGKGSDYKITESMYIEKYFHIANEEGAENMIKKEWEKNFMVMDINGDGVISKTEHRRFFDAWKNFDPNCAIVSFTAIDENMDGEITCDEYVKAGTEFFFNFTDDTKPSKYFFGLLVQKL